VALGACHIPQDLRSAVYRNRDLFTLASLIAIILIFPYFEQSEIGDILFVCLFSALLLAALYEVSDSPLQAAVGVLLAIPMLLASWTDMFLHSRSTHVAELIAITIFLTYILLAILKRVLAARVVTLTEIYRAVNLYIMIGIAFGMIYTLIELLIPGSFQFTYGEKMFSSIFYFSFVALSTAGFGDIIAVSPIARSVVIIEMIFGVMYMAVLIGLLVNAHYTSRYAARKDDTGIGEPVAEGTRSKKIPFLSSGGPLSLIAIAVMVNLVTSIAMVAFRMPIFMDTWGTSFAVMTGGFWVGATAGVIYNLIMAVAVWSPSSAIWAASSLLVASLSWIFWRRKWIDLKRPHLLVAAGLATGFFNALLVIAVTFLIVLPPYEGTLAVDRFFSGVIGIPAIATFVSTVVVEVTDKTLSLVLAAVVALFLREYMEKP
jgi:hypothetical protein